ncbi:MAG: hypothetical protein ACE5MI_00285 [Acidimicrobiia bacterium]
MASNLTRLTEADWENDGLPAAHSLRRKRADSPLVLAATEAALSSDPSQARLRLEAFSTGLTSVAWAREAAARLTGFSTVGVTSLGSVTLMVLDEALGMGTPPGSLLVDRRYLARGLAYLDTTVAQGPPEEADAVLAAGAAAHGSVIWTTQYIADVIVRARIRGASVIAVVHPLAELSPLNREVYRPAHYLVEADR